jgi:hypothetical protein
MDAKLFWQTTGVALRGVLKSLISTHKNVNMFLSIRLTNFHGSLNMVSPLLCIPKIINKKFPQ